MKCVRYRFAVLAVAFAPFAGLAPRAFADELDENALYEKTVKSCVFIITEMKSKHAVASGSGSLIDAEKKLVLTNYHVVDEEQYVYVQFPFFVKGDMQTDKKKYMDKWKQHQVTPSKVLFRDKARDLAIVKVDKIPPGTSAIPLAKTSPKTGIPVWQIGNAGAITSVFRVSKGQVSAVGMEKFTVGGDDGDAFQVSAKMVTATNPINPGDSGGPLFDKRGYQVAVSESGDFNARLVNRFVDISEVRELLADKNIKIKELGDEPDPKEDGKDGPEVKKGTEPKKDGSSGASPADERTAAEKLRSAKLFSTGEDLRDTYVAKLKEIVAKWPKTEAAKKAQELLNNLK
jgi:hypothetical protein